MERTRSLYADGLAARRDYENTQIKVAEHAAKLAEAKAKLSRVDIALNRQSAQVVRAPRDGRIQAINTSVGAALVSAGDWLATLAPENSQRVVELQIDGRDVLVIKAESNGKTVYRVRAVGYTRDEANAACNGVTSAGGKCFIARN